MTARTFASIAFTPTVKALQEDAGSREGYARMEDRPAGGLGPREWEFLRERDSFYMASVSETGWPYVQHRGGPPGFLKVLEGNTIGFADFSGNKQYVSTGNLTHEDRVSLILVDYPNRKRLKLMGHTRFIGADDPLTLERLAMTDYPATVERGVLIDVVALDWNCPQHITPRYTVAEIEAVAGRS